MGRLRLVRHCLARVGLSFKQLLQQAQYLEPFCLCKLHSVKYAHSASLLIQVRIALKLVAYKLFALLRTPQSHEDIQTFTKIFTTFL